MTGRPFAFEAWELEAWDEAPGDHPRGILSRRRGVEAIPVQARSCRPKGMNASASHLVPAGIALTIASAATALDRAGYAHSAEITISAALAAAALMVLVRAAPTWFRVG